NGVYGYDYIVGEGILKVNEVERITVNRIYDEYIKGTSMLGICKIMNDENVQTKRGGKWSQSTIRSILTNPLYIGRVRYGVNKKIRHRAFETDGIDVEPIIDEEKFELVQETMKKRGQFKSKKYPSENTYYYRVMKCGACGGGMHARQQKKNGVTYITYACNNRLNGTCTEPGFSHSKIEEAFVGLLKKFKKFMPEESIILSENKKLENKKAATNIENEIKKLYTKKDEVRDQFVRGSIEFDEYRLVIEKLEKKRTLLNEELSKYKEDDKKEEYTLEDIKKAMVDINKNWQKLTNLERRNFLEQFVKYISVKKVKKKIEIKDVEFNN
ncbi:MAG: recombinase family protein, partial [Clostridia bacterium]|nr:recombinase family protein [Clostridia bacterium]